MRKLLAIFVIVLMTSGPLMGGAWPRGEGRHFISTTSRIAATDLTGAFSVYSTFYYEYGMSDKLTLGVDLGRAVSGNTKAIVYARWSLGHPEGRNQFALEIGAGKVSGEAVIRPGFSFGRGIETKWGHGWVSIEGMAEHHIKTGITDFKADLTFGLDLAPRMKMLLQLQTGTPYRDDLFVRFAPSLVFKTTAKSHIEFGVTAGITGDSQYGLKMGIWRDF